MTWFLIVILTLLIVVIAIVVLNRFYHKGSRDRALIRTGAGGQKIVMDAGCLVLPFLHRVEEVDMCTFFVNIVRRGEQSLLTSDRLRIDVNVSFHIRVIPTIDGIATAAQTIGARSLSSEQLTEFLRGRFYDALQAVAAVKTMDELHENRSVFAKDVTQLLREGLENLGLRLESVSITQLDQTSFSALDENNAFNAVGMRRLAEIITTNRRKRKEIEANADTAIRRTELENTKTRLALELEREQAESEKTIKSEQLNSEISCRTAEERERAQSASELVRVTRESELRRAEIERDSELRKKEISALQNVEEARINSQIELAVRRGEESEALVRLEHSKRAVVTAEEEIKREKQRLATESEGIIAALKIEQEAAIQLRKAQGVATSAIVTAENEDKIAELNNARKREETEIEVEKCRAMIGAENEINDSLIAMKLEEKRLQILPEMAAKMAKPLEKIGKININQISGLARESNSGRHTGNLGSVVDDVMDLALRMPAVRKLGEAVGAQITLDSSENSQLDDNHES